MVTGDHAGDRRGAAGCEVLASAAACDHAACMCLAVPGRLLDVAGDDELYRTGRVDFGGVVKSVSLACVPEARAGDYLLVHVGMALSVVDETEAARVFALLDEMGELADLEPDDGPSERLPRGAALRRRGEDVGGADGAAPAPSGEGRTPPPPSPPPA